MIYLDSSAVVKMVRLEPGTVELVAWLNDHATDPLTSSALVEVEVPRALRRNAPEALGAVSAVLRRLHLLEIDTTIRVRAGGYGDTLLRSLDAIHLATAQALVTTPGDSLTAFIAYDRRLNEAARALDLPVVDPAES